MALIPGSVRVGGFIAPSDTTDGYSTHDSIYGRGGHRETATIVDRDAISADRRREGMTCYVSENATTYQLTGGILNTDWQPLVFITATAAGFLSHCSVDGATGLPLWDGAAWPGSGTPPVTTTDYIAANYVDPDYVA